MAKKETEEPKEEPEAGAEGEEGGETPKKSKRPLVLGGGVVGLIALAFILSQVAVPKGPQKAPPFQGPYVIDVAEGDVQVNLDGGKRYLVMQLKAQYDAYDEAYAAARVVDPLYMAMLNDALIRLGRKKSSEELNDQVGEEVFTAEIRDAIDPLLFPLHVGNESDANLGHPESGLAPGRTAHHSTMRGGFKAHVLHVDAPNKTIRLDEGPETPFEGTEDNLAVEDARGQRVYLDVTALDPEFVGEVNIGTFGSIDKILFSRLLVQ